MGSVEFTTQRCHNDSNFTAALDIFMMFNIYQIELRGKQQADLKWTICCIKLQENCIFYLQSNSLDELGVGDDDDGDGDGEAEGVDEDDVAHVGVQGWLCPNNTTAKLTRNIRQLKQS